MNRRGFFGAMLATPLLGLFRKKPKTRLQVKVSNDMGASEWSEPIEVDDSWFGVIDDHGRAVYGREAIEALNAGHQQLKGFKQTARSYGIILGD